MALRKQLHISKKDGRTRGGRGFSGGELKKAGISLRQAAHLEQPVDSRRITAHVANVKFVKRLFKKQVFERG